MHFDYYPHCDMTTDFQMSRYYDKEIKERSNVFIIQNFDAKPGT